MSLRKDMADIIKPYLEFDTGSNDPHKEIEEAALKIADEIIDMIAKATVIIHPEPAAVQ